MNHIEIDSFSAYIPRNNFLTKITSDDSEKHFVEAFQKVYLSRQKKQGICGKEFAISGFGIADLMYAQIIQTNESIKIKKITAFEMKLKNWKKAISQTYRYSYFADRAIIVMPPDYVPRDDKTISLIKKLGIGLWIFNKNSSRIYKLITPQYSKARLYSARKKACAAIAAYI